MKCLPRAFLALVLLSPVPALATPEFSGVWEVAVREFGAKDYTLPMVDGRLTLQKQGPDYIAHYDQVLLTGRPENGRLQLACTQDIKPCGQLTIDLSGDRIVGTGTLLGNAGDHYRQAAGSAPPGAQASRL